MASLSDLLTAMQNGVVAISTVAQRVGSIYNNLTTASLYQGPATVPGPAIIYTAASNASSHIDYILFCNTTAGSLNVSMSIVAPGGVASAANAVFSGSIIPANTTVTWTGKIIVPAGYTVQAGASGAGMSITVSGGTSV
jgi:hypothetical protein